MTLTTKNIRRMTTRPLRAASAAVVLCGALTAGCSDDPQWPSGDSVRIGVKEDQPGTGYKPGSYEDFEGFDIDVAKMAADALGKKPSFDGVRSLDRQTVLDGKHGINLVVATFSINRDRLKDSRNARGVDFVGPYAVTGNAFLLRSDSPKLQRKADLQGKKLCTWGGTTSKDILEWAGIKNVTTDKDAGECIKSVREGGAYAAFSDELLLRGFANQDKRLVVVPSQSSDLPNDLQYYGIALEKGHPDQCNRIKEALKKYVEGTGQRKWDADFAKSLKNLRAREYKPNTRQIDSLSCRDKLP
jgi:glutamate transport system substrate-binding protein